MSTMRLLNQRVIEAARAHNLMELNNVVVLSSTEEEENGYYYCGSRERCAPWHTTNSHRAALDLTRRFIGWIIIDSAPVTLHALWMRELAS